MLRAFFVSAVLILLSGIVPGLAEPEPAGDLATCRERQSDAAVRQHAKN